MEREYTRQRRSRKCSVCRLPVKGHTGPCGPGNCLYERAEGSSDEEHFYRLESDRRLQDRVRHLRKDSKVTDIARRVWSERTSDESEDTLTPRPRSVQSKSTFLSSRPDEEDQTRHARARSEPPQVSRHYSASTKVQDGRSPEHADAQRYTGKI
ncbi:Hypp8051 [Branchiostoma lanceolatum]|uniref:Hypp8051 protein n=1 Tax=Branchiostoma lanceolatum TaxID=7740 RepID=A0A8J9Z6M2_BRALA|nr:Hypp8051 [Branchiostoma lanceolatum]